MITHSILPQHRAEVSTLIDELDEIIDALKSSLNEINIEMPDIPPSLNKNFISLTETSVTAAEELFRQQGLTSGPIYSQGKAY